MRTRNRWYALRGAALLLLAAAAGCRDDPPGLLPERPAMPIPGASYALSGTCVIQTNTKDYIAGSGFEAFNDFGRILADADNAGCVANAATTLRLKLANTRVAAPNTWSTLWLGGNYVALIFAAADRIGAYGYMTPELDSELQHVANTFGFVDEPFGCGLTVTDNCMDTYSGAASGFAWIAEYQYRRGDAAAATTSRGAAKTYIDATFDGACIRKLASTSGYCDGTVADLDAGIARTLSLNEGQQWPAYGFGLMTSIAAAALGYDGSGPSITFSAPQKSIARGLFEEARRMVDVTASPDTFLRRCVRPSTALAGGWALVDSTADCSGLNSPGAAKYTPQMYALYTFYGAKMSYTPPAGGYQSMTLHLDTFQLAPAERGQWFGFGRYETYAELGNDWWKTRRPYMPMDAHNPLGYVDRIDGARVAYGWACDRDTAQAAVRVELTVNGTVFSGLANKTSENAINTQCNGGSAHRFAIPLLTSPVGATVTARALDYTFGSSVLPCATGGACVVPPPPTLDISWVKPSEASWGPPNTLTVAGHAAGGTGGVKLEWRDVTFTSNPAWNVVSWEPTPDASNTWSNTIPSPYYCHTFQVRATYFGVTTPTFTYNGASSTHCKETARVIWIQPSSTAGWGTPGALIVAGEARNAPPGTTVSMWWRNVTTGGPWVKAPYAAPTDANGIWIHDIPNASYAQQYAAYVKYDVVTSSTCTYAGGNNITWC